MTLLIIQCLLLSMFANRVSSQPSSHACPTFETMKQHAEELKQGSMETSCSFPETCLEFSCDIESDNFYGTFSLAFRPCMRPLSLILEWHGFGTADGANATIHINNSSNKEVINVKGSTTVSQLVIESVVIDPTFGHYAILIKMKMILTKSGDITLLPQGQLVIPSCIDDDGLFDHSPELPSVTNTPPYQPIRINTTNTCVPSVLGTCRNNEICIPNKNKSSAAFCYCFDDFNLDSDKNCIPPSFTKKQTTSIAAIVCGVIISLVILAAMLIVIRRYMKRTMRRNDFHLLNNSTISDPPMIEA